jgi:very-short-patch-repair endonuclease
VDNTAIIGTITACILIAAAIALWAFVVHLLNRPSRRNPSAGQPSAAGIDPASADTSLQAPEAPAPSPYARIPHLLTAAEGDFFAVLQSAAPAGMLLFAQVRLANLVEVQSWARYDKTHWYKIQAKCVDFVLCEPCTFIPRLVIELDDSSHKRADRRERDAFVDAVLAAASLPIMHVRWQRRYDPRVLAQQIAVKLSSTPPITSQTPLPAPVPLAAITPSLSSVPPPNHAPHSCGHCQANMSAGAKFCPDCGAIMDMAA